MSEHAATPSLRRRVTLLVLLLIGVVLVVLVVAADLALRSRLEGQLRQRLADRAVVGQALSGQVDPRDLARRLEGDGISVVVTTSDGKAYAEGPLAGAATAPTAQPKEGAQGGTPSPGADGPGPPPSGGPKASTDDIVQRGDRLSISRTLDDGDTLLLLADATDVRRTLTQVRIVLIAASLIVLLVAAVAVPVVVDRGLVPLRRITGVAQDITRGDRERRLRPDRPDTDLGRTATAFDGMLDDVVGAESRARDSEARLRAFLSDAAHELRTPLTGVQAGAENLLRTDPPRAEREALLLGLVRETRRAGRLVDDMLLMARIDRGLSLASQPLDLAVVAAEVAETRRVGHPGVRLEVGGDPTPTAGDPDRLHQVVANLVDNAVRAADRVTLTTWQRDDRVGVDVRDDGPGVPPDQRERIFERLVRLDDARARGDGGSGLGLTIARGIARAHGGDLECLDPGPGGGALFRLSLPA